MKKLTLIGSAPLTGKTTLSRQLAADCHAVEMSSDQIRNRMKQTVRPNDYPGLFYDEGVSAEEFYERYATAQSVMDGEIGQGKQVETGMYALLDTAISWEHMILEGIAVTPEFMQTLIERYPHIAVERFVLVDNDANRIRERITARGLWGRRDSYPSDLIPREIEWVILYNQWFAEQATKFGIEIRVTKPAS